MSDTSDIEIIGSINHQTVYSTTQISALLISFQTELEYGKTFMGRPSTQLHVNDEHVMKIRSELDLNNKRAKQWVNHTLNQERDFAAHHPKKTWFLFKKEQGHTGIGNICPRLSPLHTLIGTKQCHPEQQLLYLQWIYHTYFRIAATFNKRLDEGLSNFGIDENNQCYYLDDDIYNWDKFVTFAHLLGVLIRANNWLDQSIAFKLGDYLQQLCVEFYPNQAVNITIVSHLKHIFIPDLQRSKLLEIIIQRLSENKVISKKVQGQQRYWAILADVHANLPALQTVLDFFDKENIHQGLVLGDIVGYGPHPVECIELLQNTEFSLLKGNHDDAVATENSSPRGMSKTASWCIAWTLSQVSVQHRLWLEQLPLELTGKIKENCQWQAVHGAPIDPNYFYAYVYMMTYQHNLDNLQQREIQICFHGHSHIQGIYVRKKGRIDGFLDQSEILLEPYQHSLICPGSVGQPRNGQAGAQCAIYDTKEQRIQFFNLDYSLDKTINDMQQNGFPSDLIKRLHDAR